MTSGRFASDFRSDDGLRIGLVAGRDQSITTIFLPAAVTIG